MACLDNSSLSSRDQMFMTAPQGSGCGTPTAAANDGLGRAASELGWTAGGLAPKSTSCTELTLKVPRVALLEEGSRAVVCFTVLGGTAEGWVVRASKGGQGKGGWSGQRRVIRAKEGGQGEQGWSGGVAGTRNLPPDMGASLMHSNAAAQSD